MSYEQIRSIAADESKRWGYHRSGAYFWKHGQELTTVVHLQRSRWGTGLYVNFGLIPRRFVVRRRPPGSEYWAFGDRAEVFDSPHLETFRRIALDSDQIDDEVAVRDAFKWLFQWIDRHLADEEALRAAVRDPASWLSRRADYTVGILGDWSRGELKAPEFYYSYGSYFRK
jgi:hypothetical protein